MKQITKRELKQIIRESIQAIRSPDEELARLENEVNGVIEKFRVLGLKDGLILNKLNEILDDLEKDVFGQDDELTEIWGAKKKAKKRSPFTPEHKYLFFSDPKLEGNVGEYMGHSGDGSHYAVKMQDGAVQVISKQHIQGSSPDPEIDAAKLQELRRIKQ